MIHMAEAERPSYGLLAEFDSPETLLAAANRVREAGYVRSRRLRPVPRARPGRGHRVPRHPRPADRADRRHRRRADRVLHAVVRQRLSYPLDHRRPPAQQLAGMDPDHLRADRARAPPSPRSSACSRSTACRCRTTRCSTCPTSASPAATGSSSRIEANDPKFDLARRGRFLQSLKPVAVDEVPA